MNNHLKKIQQSEEKVKRPYIIGASAVLCMLFLLIWMQYFRSITAFQDAPRAAVVVPEDVSFVNSLRAGTADIARAAGGVFSRAASFFTASKDIEVNPN